MKAIGSAVVFSYREKCSRSALAVKILKGHVDGIGEIGVGKAVLRSYCEAAVGTVNLRDVQLVKVH